MNGAELVTNLLILGTARKCDWKNYSCAICYLSICKGVSYSQIYCTVGSVWIFRAYTIMSFGALLHVNSACVYCHSKGKKSIEIIDIECVLGHESCLHFFRKCPFKSAMLNLTRSWTAELYYRKFIINRSLNITITV